MTKSINKIQKSPKNKVKPAKVHKLVTTGAFAIGMTMLLGAIPFPYPFNEELPIAYITEKQESSELEIGDSKILQQGQDGSKIVTSSSLQSIWGIIFKWQPLQQKEISSEITKESISKIVAEGTLRYQYMLCSDGSSRQYTDEQFKDPKVGFTSKSADYCKENNQGEMIKLSDTEFNTGSTNSKRKPTVTSRDGCTYTSIPYKTVYQDVSWLNKGETRVSKGSDGTKSSCGWSTNPVDEIVSRGMGKQSSSPSETKDTNNKNTITYTQCLATYQSAISQIQAAEFQGIAGTASLRRTAESEFSRCKRDAGF